MVNALGRGVSRKLDRMTWCSEWITLSLKFASKSFWESGSQNLSLAKREGREEEEEEEEEEAQWVIGFLEGTDFLGAIVRKLKEKKKKKKKNNTTKKMLKKEGKRSAMHGNAWTCYVQTKINCIMSKNPIQTTTLTSYNQSHKPRMHET